MSKLITRGAVLTASRVSNFVIQAFSPLLLVRILEVEAYGQYQEFMIYAALLTVIAEYAVDSSLTYFLPRYPDRERAFVTQSTLITLCLSVTCVTCLFVFRPMLMKLFSFDFIAPLGAYVLFFVSMSWIEYFWIARGQVFAVMAYSFLRLLLRIAVLLTVALLTRDVMTILWSLAAFEATKAVVMFVYFATRGMFTTDMRKVEVLEQIKFAFPVGSSALIQQAGRNIGKIFISSSLGPAALAYYAVGSYLLPIIRVLRSGITDAIYPELVRAGKDREGAVRLWQRVNVLNCVMFFPAFAVLVAYSNDVISLLFTKSYLPAVPVFVVLAFFLLRRCFNSDVLLRTTGKTGFMLAGTAGALVINIVLIGIASKIFGLIGPAIAFLMSEVLLEIYYLRRARVTLGISLGQLVEWKSIVKIAASCLAAFPVLLMCGWFIPNTAGKLVAAIPVYFAIVLVMAYRLGVADIGRVAVFVSRRMRRLVSGKGAS
jgi:O-antigen/teichoic acid export membrane protein